MTAAGEEEPVPSHTFPSLEIVFGVILCCVLVTAIVGNTLTFLVVIKMKSWNSSAIMFIAHLGIVDILNSLLITPFSAMALFTGRNNTIYSQGVGKYPEVYQWICDINGFMFIAIRVLVPLTNLNIAVDRAIAVTFPLKYATIMNTVSVLFIVACDWLIALIFACTTIFVNRGLAAKRDISSVFFEYNDYTTLCFPSMGNEDHYLNFVTSLTVSTVIIPFIAVFILSMIVIKILVSKENVNPGGNTVKIANGKRNPADIKKDKRAKRTKKATHTLLIVVFLYMMLWLPYVVLWLLDVSDAMRHIPDTIQLHFVTIATLCISFNSATNPLIFITRSEKYRSVICQSAGGLKKRMLTVKEELTAGTLTHDHHSARQDSYAKDIDHSQQRTETFL